MNKNDVRNNEFQDADRYCTGNIQKQKENKLLRWQTAQMQDTAIAEEHLMPLHVVTGGAGRKG
jgi:aromatic ring-opening dioxygenase catalytic subunit (LigB family)